MTYPLVIGAFAFLAMVILLVVVVPIFSKSSNRLGLNSPFRPDHARGQQSMY